MPLDVGRVTHLLEQMHRSEDDAGDPIVADKVLVTDGAAGFTWEDYGAAGGDRAVVEHGAMGATETLTYANEPDDPTTPTEGPDHTGTLSADLTLTLAGAPTSGNRAQIDFLVKQDGTGGHEIVNLASIAVWPDGVTPSLSQGAGDEEWLSFITEDGGSVWYGFHTGGTSAVVSLDDLSDVVITSPTEGQMLSYRSGMWVNEVPTSTSSHWEVLMTGSAPPEPVTNAAEDDWIYGEV